MKNKSQSTCCSYFLIAASIFIGMHCFAQDTLVKRDGRQLLGKVLEVSLTEVKYKKAELPDGPIYIEDKGTIVKIKYQGGYVDLFPETLISIPSTQKEKNNQYRVIEKYPSLKRVGSTYIYNNQDALNEREMHDFLLTINDPQITNQIRKARLSKGLRYVGFLAVPLGIAAIAYGTPFFIFRYSHKPGDENVTYALAAAGGVVIGASIHFNINRSHRNARALRFYQQNYMLKQ